MEFSDFDEYNFVYQSDDYENEMFNERQDDKNQTTSLPALNDDDDQHDVNNESPNNENIQSIYFEKYVLPDECIFAIKLWILSHQHRPYMNTQAKQKLAKRFNVSVDSISLFLSEQRRISLSKNNNANQ